MKNGDKQQQQAWIYVLLKKIEQERNQPLALLASGAGSAVRQGTCISAIPGCRILQAPRAPSAVLPPRAHLRPPQSSTAEHWLRESSPLYFSTNHALLRDREKATHRGELNRKDAPFYTARASEDAKESADPAVYLGSVAAKLCQPTHAPGAQAEKQAEMEGLIPFAFFSPPFQAFPRC